MISHRYVWSTAALLLIALIPTVLNVYRAPPALPAGELAVRIPSPLAGFGPDRKGPREASWVSSHFGKSDFVSRVYRSDPLGNDLALFGARSYDAKRLFHFPELALNYGEAATSDRFEQIPVGEHSLRVRLLTFRTHRTLRMSAYALIYDGRSVGRPVPFLLAQVPQLFLGQRKPMALIYVQGQSSHARRALLRSELERLLAASCRGLLR